MPMNGLKMQQKRMWKSCMMHIFAMFYKSNKTTWLSICLTRWSLHLEMMFFGEKCALCQMFPGNVPVFFPFLLADFGIHQNRSAALQYPFVDPHFFEGIGMLQLLQA